MLRQVDSWTCEMRLRRTPQTSPEHWSKDFVEHLRTVHFALVTVSAALILILTSKQYDAKRARTELDAIVVMKQEIDSLRTTPDSDEVSPWFQAKSIPTTKGIGSHQRFIFHRPLVNQFWCDFSSRSGGEYIPFKGFPDTVRAFQPWWDSNTVAPLIVDTLYDVVSGAIVDPATRQPVVRLDITEEVSKHTNATELFVDYDRLCTVNPPPTSVPSLTLRSLDLTGVDFSFTVTTERMVINNQLILGSYFKGQKKGQFADTFYDLMIAAQGREMESFNTLAPELREEATKTGEAFEAFGIKFPSEQVTRWGLIVLIMVQLYFIMYLTRLSNKLRPDDPGWDTPWMAMDESRLARVMLVVSVIALPCVAALLVLIRAESSWFPGGFTWHSLGIVMSSDWPNRVEFVLMPFVVLFSFVLSGLAWHYRPRLTEPLAPAQLFE
jgi:hypothetical protein